MKKILLSLFAITLFSNVFAIESALVCPRYDEIYNSINENIDCTADSFLEGAADKVFGVELDYFDENVVQKIMSDDISNPNWLSQKGIYELREHKLCLENACDVLLNKCDTNKNISIDNSQSTWCQKTADNIFDIQKIKIKTAVLENQYRKTRSTQREKYRAMEVRTAQYFSSNLVDFIKEFTRFTEKITAFILNPLQ